MIVWSLLHIGHPVQKFADFIAVLSLLLVYRSLKLETVAFGIKIKWMEDVAEKSFFKS